MGWCSATEIMDAAVGAADALLASMRPEPEVFNRQAVDEVLRPFVAAIAAALRDGDWDCIEEADAFDRFRQEMLGYDDERMADWYREQLAEIEDPKRLREYSEALATLLERINF